MKKSFSLKGFYTFSIVGAAVVIAAAIILLLTIGGVTAPAFTLGNLSVAFLLKAVVAAVIIYGLTLIYYLISYKKLGLKISLFALIGGALSVAVAFSFCVICRAPLGHLSFAIMLSSLAFSYISSALFFRAFTQKKERKRKDAADEATPFEEASSKSFRIMLYCLLLVTLILVAGFVVSMIFSSTVLMSCVLPAILSLISAVVITLAFACRMYSDKK